MPGYSDELEAIFTSTLSSFRIILKNVNGTANDKERIVLDLIIKSSHISREVMSEESDLPLATVSRIVNGLRTVL